MDDRDNERDYREESSESESDDEVEQEQELTTIGENDSRVGVDDPTTWDRKYEALLKFYEERGHCNVPQKFKQTMSNGETVALGRWLYGQRVEKKRGILTGNKLERLQALVNEGKLIWDPAETDDKIWNERFALLCSFAKQHGHTNIPKDHAAQLSDGSPADLRNWIQSVLKQKRRNTLRDERAYLIQRDLVDPGYFQWPQKEDSEDVLWQNRYEALLHYGEEHGNCNLNENYTCIVDGANVRLGTWLNFQRQEKKAGTLRADRVILLEKLVAAGKLSWDAPKVLPGTIPPPTTDSSKGALGEDVDIWDKKFEALKQFGVEHGHYNVPDVYLATMSDGTKTRLGRWLCKQRMHQYKGILKPEREAKLQVLVNEGKLRWEGKSRSTVMSLPLEPSWDEFFPLLLKYRALDGSLNAPKDAVIRVRNPGDVEEKVVEIGQWLHLQRAAYRSGRLHPQRQAQMQALVDAGRLRWMSDDMLDQQDLWSNQSSVQASSSVQIPPPVSASTAGGSGSAYQASSTVNPTVAAAAGTNAALVAASSYAASTAANVSSLSRQPQVSMASQSFTSVSMASSSFSSSSSFALKNAAVLVKDESDSEEDDDDDEGENGGSKPSSSSAKASGPATQSRLPFHGGTVIELPAPKRMKTGPSRRIPRNGVLHLRMPSSASNASTPFQYDTAALFSRPPPLILFPPNSIRNNQGTTAALDGDNHASKRFKSSEGAGAVIKSNA